MVIHITALIKCLRHHIAPDSQQISVSGMYNRDRDIEPVIWKPGIYDRGRDMEAGYVYRGQWQVDRDLLGNSQTVV